jgi:hypothetical protein
MARSLFSKETAIRLMRYWHPISNSLQMRRAGKAFSL